MAFAPLFLKTTSASVGGVDCAAAPKDAQAEKSDAARKIADFIGRAGKANVRPDCASEQTRKASIRASLDWLLSTRK
jgi:hypothetical protein